jgi:hypothetical protein
VDRLSIPWRRVGACVLLLLGGGSLVLVIAGDDGSAPRLTITLGGPGQHAVTLGEAGREQLEAIERSELDGHGGLRDERPESVPAAQLGEGRAQLRELARHDRLPEVAPLAAPAQPGCSSRFVRNFSSRNGVAPRLWVLHYTVSANRLGVGDVNAIVAWFDQTRSQASSHYVIDAEGHCAYIVRESDKAWTQAAYNPVSLSAEVINTGHDSTYAGVAGLARLAQVLSDSAGRWGIPLQRGAVAGCTVVRPGVVDHAQLGACGGGHGDIAPFDVDAVIAAAAAHRRASAPPPSPLTAVERRIVAGLARPAGTGHSRRWWCRRDRDQRTLLRSAARTRPGGWTAHRRGTRYQLLARAYTRAGCR